MLCVKGLERISCSEKPSVASPGSRIVISSCVCACPPLTDSCAAHGSRLDADFPQQLMWYAHSFPWSNWGWSVPASCPWALQARNQSCAGALGSSIHAPLPAEPMGRGAWTAAGAPPPLPQGCQHPFISRGLHSHWKGASAGGSRVKVSLCPGCSPELFCAPAWVSGRQFADA